MTFAPRLRGKHTVRSTSAKTGEIERSTGLQASQYGKPYTVRASGGSADVDKLVRDGYERVVWVYRCMNVIAGTAARLPIEFRRGQDADAEIIENHPLLPRLNMRANLSESAGFFKRRLSQQLQVSPRGAFVEMSRTNGGEITALTLLPPARTAPVPDAELFVREFQVKIGTKVYAIDPDNVLWFRNAHPTDPYRSMTPLEACGIAVDTDFAASLLNATFLRNNNQPGGIVGVKDLGVDSDADELRAYFAAGARIGQWRVVDAEVSVAELSSTLDAQYRELKAMTKAEICEGWGVPVSMIGNASERTYANADAEVRDVFWGGTMPDHLDALTDVFDLVDGDETSFMRYVLDDVPALQDAKRALRDEERQDVQASVIAIDEARATRGLDPLPDGAGALPRVSIATVPIGTTRPAPAPPAAPTPPPHDGEGGTVAPPEPAKVATNGGRHAAKAAATDAAVPSRDDLRELAHWHLERQEAVVLAELQRFFERQKRATLARLTGPKARRATRHEPPHLRAATATVTKQLDADWIFQIAKWDDELATVAAGFLAHVMGESGQAVYDVFLGGGLKAKAPTVEASFDVTDPTVAEAIGRRTARIVGANATTRDAIRAAVAEGDDAGETIDQIAGRVTDVFGQAAGYRSEMIARTETGSAHNEAQLIAAQDSGVVATKSWLTVGDDRVRDSHVEAESIGDIALDEYFDVGGEQMLQPGDDNADPGETINCRCVMVLSPDAAGYGLDGGDTADEG